MCCYGRGLCARNRCLCDDEFSSATHCSKHAHFHSRNCLSELSTVALEIVRKNRDPNLNSKKYFIYKRMYCLLYHTIICRLTVAESRVILKAKISKYEKKVY